MTLYNHNTMDQSPPRTVTELLITRCLARNVSAVYRSFYIIIILQNAAGSENQHPLQARRADGWRNNNQTYFRQTAARCHFLNRTNGSWKITQLSMDRGTVLKTQTDKNNTLQQQSLTANRQFLSTDMNSGTRTPHFPPLGFAEICNGSQLR
jgi:hypothetical protein